MDQPPSNFEFVPPDSEPDPLRGVFSRSYAVLIAVNHYGAGIPSLRTAVSDAAKFAHLLHDDHQYHTLTLTQAVDKALLQQLFQDYLPPLFQQSERCRLIVYFAGHGLVEESAQQNEGYLLLADATAYDTTSFLSMSQLYDWIKPLRCKHLLVILDCCYAGVFRWVSTQRNVTSAPKSLFRQRYERYLNSTVRQALASSAHNQRALDVVAEHLIGQREPEPQSNHRTLHSPFASRLFEGLGGKADFFGQGIITASALAEYVNPLHHSAPEPKDVLQTPIFWSLKDHEFGDYIFLVPGRDLRIEQSNELAGNNPYRGLLPYEIDHARTFGGRSQALAEVWQRLEQFHFVVILGPSGTGKSSLLRAGVLASCQDHGFTQRLGPIRPGPNPFESLGQAIKNEGWANGALESVVDSLQQNPYQKVLIAFDQFEELITETAEAETASFLESLWTILDNTNGQIRIVATLRSDFESYFESKELLTDRMRCYWYGQDGESRQNPKAFQPRYLLPAMDRRELREAIEAPARERNLFFEPPELVNTLIDEVVAAPGSLPLLSFTLSELYDCYVNSDRGDQSLLEADYICVGRISGAVHRRAEHEYETLPDDAHKDVLRRVMLRMVALEAGDMSRRRVPIRELEYCSADENERVKGVLDKFIAERLLVRGSTVADDSSGGAEAAGTVNTIETIEPAHDALIQSWQRLQDWYEAAQNDYLPLQERMRQAVQNWTKADGKAKAAELWDHESRLTQLHKELAPGDYSQVGWRSVPQRLRRTLWPGTPLPQRSTWMNRQEVAFVRASVQKRARSAQLAALMATLLLFAIFSALGMIIFEQQQTLRQREATLIEQSGRLAEAALKQLETDPAASVDLSLAALPDDDTPRPYVATAEYSLTQAMQRLQERRRLPAGVSQAQQVAFGPNGIAVGGAPVAYVPYSVTHPLSTIESTDVLDTAMHQASTVGQIITSNEADVVAWAPNGDLLSYDGAQAIVWRSSHALYSWAFDEKAVAQCAAWSPDSQAVLLCRDTTAALWLPTAESVLPILEETSLIVGAAWSADGSHLAVTTAYTVYIYDMRALPNAEASDKAVVLDGTRHSDDITGVTFFDNNRLLTWSRDGSALLWTVSGEWQHTFAEAGERLPVRGVAPSLDGSALAVYYSNGVIRIWSTADPAAAPTVLRGHNGQAVTSAAWNGNFLATGGVDGAIYLWDTGAARPDRPVTILTGHTDRVNQVAWEPSRRFLISHAQDGTVRWWRVLDEDGAPICAFDAHDQLRCRTLLTSTALLSAQPTDARLTSQATMLVATARGDVLTWDLSTQVESVAVQPTEFQRSVALSEDGRAVFAYVRQAGGSLWQQRGSAWTLLQEVAGPIDLARWQDGRIVVLRNIGMAEIIDPATGQVHQIDVGAAPAAYDFSLHGDLLAVAYEDGSLVVWRLDGSIERKLAGKDEQKAYTNLQWDSSGQRLAAMRSFNGVITLWKLAEGRPVWSTTPEQGGFNVVGPIWSRDGKYIAFAHHDTLFVIDAESGNEAGRGLLADGQILGLEWLPNRLGLLAWTADGAVSLWVFNPGAHQIEQIMDLLPPQTEDLLTVWIAPDGTGVTTLYKSGLLLRWHVWPDLPALIHSAQACCEFD